MGHCLIKFLCFNVVFKLLEKLNLNNDYYLIINHFMYLNLNFHQLKYYLMSFYYFFKIFYEVMIIPSIMIFNYYISIIIVYIIKY